MAQGGQNPNIPQRTIVNSGNVTVNSGTITTSTQSATRNLNDPLSIGGGGLSNYSIFNFWAESNTVDTTRNVIWGLPLSPTLFPPGFAERLFLVSSNATDTATGSGARSVFVVGISSAGAPLTELVFLSGLTPVQTANFFLRVIRLVVGTTGSSKENVGNITATNAAQTLNVSYMPATENVDSVASKPTTTGQQIWIKTLTVATDTDRTVEIVIRVGAYGALMLTQLKVLVSGSGTTTIPLSDNLTIGAGDDFQILARKTSGGGAAATVTIHVGGIKFGLL